MTVNTITIILNFIKSTINITIVDQLSGQSITIILLPSPTLNAKNDVKPQVNGGIFVMQVCHARIHADEGTSTDVPLQ